MHKVKCYYCGEAFDIDSEKYYKPFERRYAHLYCHEHKELNFSALIEYARECLRDEADDKKIAVQISRFIKKGMSYDDIYVTLKYWYEVRKAVPTKAKGGIGIVPYILDEAKEYWKVVNPTHIPKLEEDVIYVKVKKNKKRLLSLEVE